MTTSFNNLPFCHQWQYSLFPCHHAHFIFLPLWHQWQRELPLMISLPLCSSCATQNYFLAESYVDLFGEETTSRLFLRYSKVSLGRGLVNISTICSFFLMYSNLMLFSMTYSCIRWNLIGIFFVFYYITGFLDMFIALVLSQSIGMVSSYFTYLSCNICFI